MLPILRVLPSLGRSAPRILRKCYTSSAPPKTTEFKSIRTTPFLEAFKSRSMSRSMHTPSATTKPSLGDLGTRLKQESISIGATKAGPHSANKNSFFPETSDKTVAYWLLGSAVSVFGIVVFGGLTRLTESGLSITEWRPVTGSRPPMNAEDWESEFAKYRASPEFALLNPNMTIDEFKKIYFMEWFHRLWGRFIGMTFAIPTIYFIARRKVSAHMAAKLVGISGMIGFQGVIGWWMVKSGLHDNLFAPGSHPRVSQYRLTTHLGAAFIVYASMLVSGISILRENSFLANPSKSKGWIAQLQTSPLRKFSRAITALSVLTFITAMSGALVAGLDAGLIYNEFPFMGNGLAPPKSELFDPFYSHIPDRSDMWWRNALENPSLVQLNHRILATTTFSAVMGLWAYTRFSHISKLLPRTIHRNITVLGSLALVQVTLGISTLLYLVPIELAAAHQAGALALLTGVLVLRSRTSLSRRTLRLFQQQRGAGTKSCAPLTRPLKTVSKQD